MNFILSAVFWFFSFLSLNSQAATAPLHDFIQSTTTHEKIEFFWSKPDGVGPFPVLLMIHPDQDSPKVGGEMFVKNGQLDYWSKKGFFTVAVSQPGYGSSLGSPDFCGPKTQQAVIDLIHHIRSLPEIDLNRFFIYGGSRGAVVASMIATKEAKLSGIILKSGVYDFVDWAASRPQNDEIKVEMIKEVGPLTQESLKDRSAYFFVDKIKAPLLILHGTHDDRAPLAIAEKFANKVNKLGGEAQLIKMDSEHAIPMPKVIDLMAKFMESHGGP